MGVWLPAISHCSLHGGVLFNFNDFFRLLLQLCFQFGDNLLFLANLFLEVCLELLHCLLLRRLILLHLLQRLIDHLAHAHQIFLVARISHRSHLIFTLLEQLDILRSQLLIRAFQHLHLLLNRFDVQLQLLLEPDVPTDLTLELLEHVFVGACRVFSFDP